MRARSYQSCLQHTQDLVEMCQQLGWLVNLEKSEQEPKQVFIFVGYQFDLRSGHVRPTPERWQNLQEKLLKLLARSGSFCHDRFTNSHRKASSPRPTAYETHIVANSNNWRVSESLEKVVPIPRSLHPHLQWWLEEGNILTGQPLHPIKHALL